MQPQSMLWCGLLSASLFFGATMDVMAAAKAKTTAKAKATTTLQADKDKKINLNQADASTLSKALPGVGPSKANRIIEYRNQHGHFKSFAELEKIEGFNEKTLQKIMPILNEQFFMGS